MWPYATCDVVDAEEVAGVANHAVVDDCVVRVGRGERGDVEVDGLLLLHTHVQVRVLRGPRLREHGRAAVHLQQVNDERGCKVKVNVNVKVNVRVKVKVNAKVKVNIKLNVR